MGDTNTRYGQLNRILAFVHLDSTQVHAGLVIALRTPRSVAEKSI